MTSAVQLPAFEVLAWRGRLGTMSLKDLSIVTPVREWPIPGKATMLSVVEKHFLCIWHRGHAIMLIEKKICLKIGEIRGFSGKRRAEIVAKPLCFATYYNLIHVGMSQMGQKEICDSLFGWLVGWRPDGPDLYEKLNDKTYSKWIARDDNINNDIERICSDKRSQPIIIDYYKDHLVPFFNVHMKERMFEMLEDYVESETMISKSAKNALRELRPQVMHDDMKASTFLAKLFLLSVSVPNKNPVKEKPIGELMMIKDQNNKCPLTGKPLVSLRQGKEVKDYLKIHIYPNETLLDEGFSDVEAPENPEDDSNLVLVNKKEGKRYQTAPSRSEYDKLKKAKANILQSKQRNSIVESLVADDNLDEKLRQIVEQMDDCFTENVSVELDYDPKVLKDKISDNQQLCSEVTGFVVSYYAGIRRMFSKSTDKFNRIAKQIKRAYEDLAEQFDDQDMIFYCMTRWVLEKLSLDDGYERACRIIVSFFVQNCEVFRAV